jgi:hypothetical protein
MQTKPIEESGTMVGPWGLEPQTFTVSKGRDHLLPTTGKALGKHGQAGILK